MENKIKFLEMIQNIVTRMASNSFMLKGWAITLVTGIFVLSDKKVNRWGLIILYVPIILFWLLDSYYLQLERKYRKLYDVILEKENDKIDFKILILPSNHIDKTCFYQSLFSITEFGFYFLIALLISVVIFFMKNVVI